MPCDIEIIKPELVNYWGTSIFGDVVESAGGWWFVKPGTAWPELLAYDLGHDWLNIAEVVPADTLISPRHPEGRNVVTQGRAAIRLGQCHSQAELPLQDVSEAIAAELVFSIWIRRRDANAANRVYLDGVPVCFDHHIAFGSEPDHRSIDGFFNDPGGDAGYASRWRVRPLPESLKPTTATERAATTLECGIHRVRDLQVFEAFLDRAGHHIMAMLPESIDLACRNAGVPKPAQVRELLITNAAELPDALTRLRRLIYLGCPATAD